MRVNTASCVKVLQRKLLSHDELKEILSPLRALVRAFYQARAKVTKTDFPPSLYLAKGARAHTCCLSEWRESSSGLQRNSRTWPKVTAKVTLPCQQFLLTCNDTALCSAVPADGDCVKHGLQGGLQFGMYTICGFVFY